MSEPSAGSELANKAKETFDKALNGVKNFAKNLEGEAIEIWKNYKYYIIGGGAAALVLFIIICCCCIRCCRKKKKKRNEEKIKLKGAKPKKKLKRIQPNKVERKAMEALGSLTYSLRYDKMSSMLMVKVIEGADIPIHDLSGYAYSFVVLKILPLHRDEEAEFKTKPIRVVGFWPVYGDVLSFVIDKEELNDQVLYLYVYELNRWSKHDGIGQVVCEIKDAGLLKEKAGEVEMTKKLRPYDPLIGLEVESGAVYLAIDYEPETWELTVEIRQGDIIPQDDEEKAASYVTLSLLNKEEELLEKRKTGSKRGTLQPMYDEEVTYTVPDNMLPDVRLLLKLKTPRFLKPSTLVGKSLILPTSDNWQQLIEKEYTAGWFPVYRKPKKK